MTDHDRKDCGCFLCQLEAHLADAGHVIGLKFVLVRMMAESVEDDEASIEFLNEVMDRVRRAFDDALFDAILQAMPGSEFEFEFVDDGEMRKGVPGNSVPMDPSN